MEPTAPRTDDRRLISRDQLALLLDVLRDDGYRLVGPTVRDGAIVHDRIGGIADLPEGLREVQEAGRYRLEPRGDRALFGYAVGPQSWKASFFAPTVRLWRARRRDGSFEVLSDAARDEPPLALIGARSCDLHAIEIQDRTLLNGAVANPSYAARRRGTFVVAVHCGQAGGTCFCVSMATGPRATFGFDLALTELLDDAGHRFVVEIGTEAGRAAIARLGDAAAPAEDRARADAIVARTATQMGRTMSTAGIKELLHANPDHPRWDDVASRCLACTNCTLVCPTCFCSTVADTTDLTGEHAERVQQWDSCFTMGHSHLHGGSVHTSFKARYRQWLTHKLASWIDQFGVSGCVGCGRCITWCPAAIDITEEVAAIRATAPA
ncbi:MAG: 4Fe-4S dicluster domain-containing protein [Deltaproteobacteria bacterium]|nr:4Fe-4S dicluster domain-containing protein [Deltaproteobacteria bacterium]